MTNNKIDYRQNKRLVVQKTNKIIGKTITYSFLAIMALFVLIPFYWMFNVSLQSNNEVLNSISISYFPKEFSPDNYIKVFLYSSTSQGNITFMDYLKNTLIVAFFSTAAGTIFSILVAFALARLNFKGKDLIFTLLLATMMIPGEMMVLSNFKTVSSLGWYSSDGRSGGLGSFYSMIIPFLVSIFHIYLLRISR